MIKYEESGQYSMEVDLEKNRLSLYYYDPKKPADIPHYLEHITSACEMLKPGFILYVELRRHVKLRLGVTDIIRKSQKITVDAGIGRAAITVPRGFLVEKMILNATKRFSKQPITPFDNKQKAIAWLDS